MFWMCLTNIILQENVFFFLTKAIFRYNKNARHKHKALIRKNNDKYSNTSNCSVINYIKLFENRGRSISPKFSADRNVACFHPTVCFHQCVYLEHVTRGRQRGWRTSASTVEEEPHHSTTTWKEPKKTRDLSHNYQQGYLGAKYD